MRLLFGRSCHSAFQARRHMVFAFGFGLTIVWDLRLGFSLWVTKEKVDEALRGHLRW